jgi:hypothetical protein
MVSVLGAGLEVDLHLSHQLLHGPAPVVPRDVRVQVLPDAFDPIVIRAIRRQEVELQAPSLFRRQRQAHLEAVMDAAVVEDHMNSAGRTVGPRRQLIEQIQEEQAGLARPLDPGEPLRMRVQDPGQVALLVLAGG